MSLTGICVLSAGAGFIICSILGLRWKFATGFTDFAIAIPAAAVAALLVATLESIFGVLQFPLAVIGILTIATILMRHGVRYDRDRSETKHS
jgi:hypothetical protein